MLCVGVCDPVFLPQTGSNWFKVGSMRVSRDPLGPRCGDSRWVWKTGWWRRIDEDEDNENDEDDDEGEEEEDDDDDDDDDDNDDDDEEEEEDDDDDDDDDDGDDDDDDDDDDSWCHDVDWACERQQLYFYWWNYECFVRDGWPTKTTTRASSLPDLSGQRF